MLSTTCPRTAAVLAAVQRRSRFAAAFGSFAQRTIDRRYCGILAADKRGLLAAGTYYPSDWYFRAVELAGGHPSAHCWTPFTPATAAPAPPMLAAAQLAAIVARKAAKVAASQEDDRSTEYVGTFACMQGSPY